MRYFSLLPTAMVCFFSVFGSCGLWASESEHDWRYVEVEPTPQPPDGAENTVLAPALLLKNEKSSSLSSPITPSATQPSGTLSGRIVYMSCGHGWTYGTSGGGQYWRLQRGTGELMNEDYGNLDQLNLFAMYCFNAGATVVPFRPIGRQSNEAVLDNDSPNVTFTGAWSNSSATNYYYGSPGDVAYRFATLNTTENATAAYTPSIPAAGFYPVYTWVQHGSNRGDQLYRIRHTGGEAQVRVPHHMVGNGWVYIGEYYFNAGSNAALGSVVISNLRGSTNGAVVIADAIRFGNGMGSIDRGGGVSDYPREEECTRYWVHAGIGVGMPSSLYDASSHDEADSWIAPSQMSAEMNRQAAGSMFKRVHISFHSNAGGGRGTMALITGDPTPNQARLAKICGDEVNDDLVGLGVPPLEVAWSERGNSTTYTGGYSEIDGSLFNYEMDATIIEVAFHDSASDAKLLRDPKARNAVARAAYHAVVKYMNEFDTADPVPLTFLPEPPNNPRAVGRTNGITLSWSAPVNQSGSSAATNYLIYTATNGYGFGNALSVGNVLTYTLTNAAADTAFYFRIVAANAAGQSFPAEVVGCRRPATNGAPQVLYVNAFDRFDRTQNLLQTTGAENYSPPDATGTIERVNPRANNAFDYVVQHGQAIHAYGLAFDSCQNEAVSGGQIGLTNYPIVIWAAGQETTGGETFSSTEQTKVKAFQDAGGHLFVSGSEIAWDLARASGPTAADRAFFANQLHASFSDANDNSGVYTVTPVSGSIFAGNGNATFDNGSQGIYWVQTPDILQANGSGAQAALYYSGTAAAAIQYDGSAGGGRVVYFGFPFETITSANLRTTYMADILNFLTPPKILAPPLSQNVNATSNVTFTVVVSGHAPLSFQWQSNGTNLAGATNSSLVLANVLPEAAGNYSVIVSNSTGVATSSAAVLTVHVPPTILTPPPSQTVVVSNAASFTVTAIGTPPLSYQWQFQGTNLLNATASAYTLASVQFADAGEYAVIVTNGAGSVTSASATLIVNPPWQFTLVTVSSNQIQMRFTGAMGSNCVVEASSNLVDWQTATNLVLTNGFFEFFDGLTNAERFFRVRQP